MTDYDIFADKYDDLREISKFSFFEVEEHTLGAIIGDVRRKSILDLACGSGYYTRKFKQDGASKVVGVDMSTKMLELAEHEERTQLLGIEYILADVSEFKKYEGCEFDLAVAVYLLYYAQTKEQLFKMCKNIFENLKVGGRFVTFDENLEQSPLTYSICSKYGYKKILLDSPLKEGSRLEINFTLPNSENINLVGYYYNRETYSEALKTAGFREVNWHKPIIPKDKFDEYGEEFWLDFITYQPLICIECFK